MKRKNFSNLKIEVQKEKNSYFEHEDYIAGTPPFLRGINSTMYLQKEWKTFFELNITSLKESNTILKQKFNSGYRCFTLVINPTEQANNFEFVVNSIDEMKILLDGIPLNKIEVNFKSENSPLPFFIYYLAAANELNFNFNQLNISIEETTNSYFKNISKNHALFSNFNLIQTIKPKEVTPELELSKLLFNTHQLITNNLLSEVKIDEIASIILFKWEASDNISFEVSKTRAARLLWANLIQQFNPKNKNSLALSIHIDCKNKYEPSLASILGGAQCITSTNTISRFLLEETNITKTIDPLAGSSIIEKTTAKLVSKNWNEYLKLVELESQSTSSNNNTIKGLNFIELALEASDKKTNLEEIFRIIKIQE